MTVPYKAFFLFSSVLLQWAFNNTLAFALGGIGKGNKGSLRVSSPTVITKAKTNDCDDNTDTLHTHIHMHIHSRINVSPSQLSSRRDILLKSLIIPSATCSLPILLNNPTKAAAAPPIAIIAEELGYFPITNRQGITLYVPARVKRSSTEQSVELAKYLSSKGAIMYGTYWCGHTSHQKELFGREAWSYINYVECSTKGVYYDSEKIENVVKNIDGFPTWYIPNGSGNGNANGRRGKGEWISGEMPLERIASLSGYNGSFDVQLEGPDGGGVGSC